MKRLVTIVLILAVVIGGSVFSYEILAQEREAAAPDWSTLPVERTTLTSTVSATGSIEPRSAVRLSFKGAGRVNEVLVSEGDRVAPGDLLASLEADELRLSLSQANTSLSISRAQLARADAGPTAADVAAAEAALSSAQAAYQELLRGPSEDELKAASGTVERAKLAVQQAQAAYDQVAHLPNVAMLPQSLQLQQATLEYELAQTNYRLATKGPSEAQKAAARAQVAQAQASLERLTSGASEEELDIARAQVRQAEVAVEQAKLAIEGTLLKAPIDGVITAVNVKAGELTTGALPAFELTDLSGFHINVYIDEIDVGAVREGQEAVISLDALPDVELDGHVASVSPTANLETGVISYRMRIDIDSTDAALRAGMSATASIITAQVADALVVPNRLIEIDRQAGTAYVERAAGEVAERVEIEIGMRNEQLSEVVAGLNEGDLLVVRQVSSLDRLRQTFAPQ